MVKHYDYYIKGPLVVDFIKPVPSRSYAALRDELIEMDSLDPGYETKAHQVAEAQIREEGLSLSEPLDNLAIIMGIVTFGLFITFLIIGIAHLLVGL